MGLVTFYASHELEAAIVKAAGASGPTDSGSGHAWDEGWAFYYGTDGTKSPYEAAVKRDENFPDGAAVHTAIVPYFNKGLISIRDTATYSDADAKAARDIIYSMWAITYLRAAFKYLEISERAYSEKAHAEGYAYYMAIDGWIASKSSSAAQTMRDALAITKTSISSGTYCAAKAAMEAAYPALGIDCTMMGTWTDSSATLTTCSTACSAAAVTLSPGASAVSAVSGSASDTTCLAGAYPRLGTYMPVSNVLEHSQVSLDVAAFEAALAGSSPDYAAAKAIYENGAGNSCKSATSARTLQGFATKDLTGESFADAFYAAGFAKDFWNTWFLEAFAGSGVFDGLSRTKRVTCLKKGAMGLVTFYASHELEAAIVKAAGASGPTDSGSGHAWDEGWAFYYGTDGTKSPYEAAVKRDENFPDGAAVHTAIVPYFNKGLISIRDTATYSDADAKAARDIIYSMWAITYLRAAFKYLEISERAYSEKAHAEGYAYYMAIDGWIASKSSSAAQTMRDALAITKTSISSGTYCAAKAAMEAAYPALGIDCTMMGTWTDSSATLTTCSTACSAAAVTLSPGASAVVGVVGSHTDVACAAHAPSPSSEDTSTNKAFGVVPGVIGSLVACITMRLQGL